MNKDVDPQRVQKLISSMREAIAILNEIRLMDQSEFLNDIHRQSSAKYNFIVAIEAAIDLANHLISKKGFRAPEDYGDTFQVLAEADVIAKDFSMELVKMARFRNRLVHLYWDVDIGEISRILQTRLDDFEKYISQIGKYISTRS